MQIGSQHQPRKRFGQHFLHDHHVIERIIISLRASPDQRWVEIGPGLGALTKHLLPLVKHLDVVELDRDVIPYLQDACQDLGDLIVHVADVLDFDFHQLAKTGELLHIVGNLPYNISTPLLFHLLEQQEIIADMHFMLQKEVVQRICAEPNSEHYGRLSVMIQYYCETHSLFNVGSAAFSPPPRVASAFVLLVPRPPALPAKDHTQFALIVRQAFSQRRKMLHNGLRNLVTSAQLEQVGIDPNCRPEQLTVADFVKISNI